MSLFSRKPKYRNPYYGSNKPLMTLPSSVPLVPSPSEEEEKKRKVSRQRELTRLELTKVVLGSIDLSDILSVDKELLSKEIISLVDSILDKLDSK